MGFPHMDPTLRNNLLRAAIAFGVPAAYAGYEAPEGRRAESIAEVLAGTALGAVPAIAIEGNISKGLTTGLATGLGTAIGRHRSHESKARQERTNALIEALSNKFVPARVRNEIDKGASMNRELFHTLVKVALHRQLAKDEDPHGLRQGLGGAVGAAVGMPAVPGGQLIGSQLGEALAARMGKGVIDRGRWAAHGGTMGGAVPPALMALLMSRML